MAEILSDQGEDMQSISPDNAAPQTVAGGPDRLSDIWMPLVLILLSLPLLLTSLGQSPIFASILGTLVAVGGAQMILGPYFWVLKRTALDPAAPVSRPARWLKLLGRKAVGLRRHAWSWMTLHPYDIVPKIMILLCGALIPFSSHVFGMVGCLALAVVLLSLSLLARNGLFLLLGAACISFATVLPTIYA